MLDKKVIDKIMSLMNHMMDDSPAIKEEVDRQFQELNKKGQKIKIITLYKNIKVELAQKFIGQYRNKKPGMGKEKGGEFERQLCKAFSYWVTNGNRDDIFWRSSMSGGRASLAIKKGTAKRTAQAGDMSYIDMVGSTLLDRFVIEYKFYKDLSISSLIYGEPKDLIIAFWAQVNRDATASNKYPMLIAKQNFKKILIGLRMEEMKKIKQRLNGLSKPLDIFGSWFYEHDLVLFDFETFLQIVHPEDITQAIEVKACKKSTKRISLQP